MRRLSCVVGLLAMVSCGAPPPPAPSPHSAELDRLEQQVAADRAAAPRPPAAQPTPGATPAGETPRYSATTEWAPTAPTPAAANASFLTRVAESRRELDVLRAAAGTAPPADADVLAVNRRATALREVATTPAEGNLAWLLLGILATDGEYRQLVTLQRSTAGTGLLPGGSEAARMEAEISTTCRAEFDAWLRAARAHAAEPSVGRCLIEMRKAAAMLGER